MYYAKLLMSISVLSLCLMIPIYPIAQELPPVQNELNIVTYCDIIITIWEYDCDRIQAKNDALDLLNQTPEDYCNVEQNLDDEFFAWKDSLFAEYNTNASEHLHYGKDHIDEIEAYLISSNRQELLDIIIEQHSVLIETYYQRKQAYNIDCAEN